MSCDKEIVEMMHQYLDGDLDKSEEKKLRAHLQSCQACQHHFHELKRTVALVTANVDLQPSPDFTKKVMSQLPTEKKRNSVIRWMRVHPMITAAAIFFILMMSGVFSAWNQDQLSYPTGKNLIVKNDIVIVPEGVTINEDIEIQNGNVKIEGKVNGDVIVINGEHLTASAGAVSGDIKQIDQIFSWLWYRLKELGQSVFDLTK
ncbi:zf-HC2 domain-containing protein [Gracilibacillus sp. YIM 98692]|uniref:zf-HC2 domain-containing protein n=1 Tax=Gracilibacillus sp. YIM 98692 TaxID=2663532 RepID=UPI0013D4769F|nr:zf-HC2 domain-containing protein [Gracilibacillus sp. YIM 98692]